MKEQDKEKVLNDVNILLISDIQADYDELVQYGFKNIDYFKSIVRADQYFAKHPEQLDKYHIILKGNQNVQRCCFDGDVELDRTISKLKGIKPILTESLTRSKNYGHTELFNYLVAKTLMNHILDKVDVKSQNFTKYSDYINPNKLSIPSKKSDLKILYLDTVEVSNFARRISEELDLNITFKEDNNRGLGRHIKTHLGDYDIIIVSHTYSRNILGMNAESTEQCKDTGRELTLLVTYDNNYWGVDKDLGNGIKLNYIFGGNAAPDLDKHSKEFRILRQPIEVEVKDEYWRKQYQSEYSLMRAIIEASVNFYNDALIKMEKSSLSDLDLKTADKLDNEYVLFIENERKRKEAEIAPIKTFDNIRYVVTSYLDYRRKGLIDQSLESLRITEGENGIKVENVYQGRTLCTIIFSKDYKQENLRVFEIQTISKKGTLSSPQMVGLYTNEYDNLGGIPNRPDEKQANALMSIEKKINVILKPLNKEACNKQLEQKILERQKTLKLKKKNNKKRKP